jgi:hypothetical protein
MSPETQAILDAIKAIAATQLLHSACFGIIIAIVVLTRNKK